MKNMRISNLRILSFAISLIVVCVFAGNLYAQSLTNRTNISIKLIWKEGFDSMFGSDWDHLYDDLDSLKGLIEWELEDQRFGSFWNVDVSTTSGTIHAEIGGGGGGLGFMSTGIGSFFNASTAVAEIYTTNFSDEEANSTILDGENATLNRICIAVSNVIAHEVGHGINQYHAYGFTLYDPSIPGLVFDSGMLEYLPLEPGDVGGLPPAIKNDANIYKSIMSTGYDVTIDELASTNQTWRTSSSELAMKFAIEGGYDIVENSLHWGIENSTFKQQHNIIVGDDVNGNERLLRTVFNSSLNSDYDKNGYTITPNDHGCLIDASETIANVTQDAGEDETMEGDGEDIIRVSFTSPGIGVTCVWELSEDGETYTSMTGNDDLLQIELDYDVIYNVLGVEIYDGYQFYVRSTVTDDSDDASDEILMTVVGDPPAKMSVSALPIRYKLGDNYPNPFNPVTTISFALPEATHVTLAVYNILGQEVARLVDGNVKAGVHSVKWDAKNAASGVYIYRIITDKFTEGKRMLVIK